MCRYLIHYIILSVCILTKAQCRHEFENLENLVETDESPEMNVYVADEDEDITPLLTQNYGNVGFADNHYDNSDFQHAFLRKPIPMQFADSMPPMYKHYHKFPGNRYVNPNYEIYKYVPSESLNSYASHRPFTPFRSNSQPTNNHPLYANLFWRKIVLPDSMPSKYHSAGSNRHSYIEDIDSFKRRSLRNRLRERNYKRYMNRLRTMNTINNKKKLTGFHPIPSPSVMNYHNKLSLPSKTSPTYYPSPYSNSYRRKYKSPQMVTNAKQTRNRNQLKSPTNSSSNTSTNTSSNTLSNTSPNKS